MDIKDVRGALARAYGAEGQTHKTMDPDLCEAQAQEIMQLFPQAVDAELDADEDPYHDFGQGLAALINRHSIENRTDTPDYILADMVVKMLRAVEHMTRAKRHWSDVSGELKVNLT